MVVINGLAMIAVSSLSFFSTLPITLAMITANDNYYIAIGIVISVSLKGIKKNFHPNI